MFLVVCYDSSGVVVVVVVFLFLLLVKCINLVDCLLLPILLGFAVLAWHQLPLYLSLAKHIVI
jgi:hypothetical protein